MTTPAISTTTTLYVSGPMANRPHHGWPEFIGATARLRAAGYRVISPHELWGEPRPELGRPYLLRADLIAMLGTLSVRGDGPAEIGGGADALAMLDGWEASKGAALEVAVARGLEMTIHPLGTWIAQAVHEGADPHTIDAAGVDALAAWRESVAPRTAGATS